MKRKLTKRMLPVAVAAAVAGGAGTANAVWWNAADGLGEVLLYEYWTVNDNYDTLISVVNTTDGVKAVKVRFLESLNSREVLDFNLYLSPFDVWTAAVTLIESPPGSGNFVPGITTRDRSCTVPAISANGVPFRTGNLTDAVGPDPARLFEGHLEMLEMGVINPTSPSGVAATHSPPGGTPNCAFLAAQWTPPGGAWLINSAQDFQSPPTGGLFGNYSLISVEDGLDFGGDAEALAQWSDRILHTDPGNLNPTLAAVNPAISWVLDVDQNPVSPNPLIFADLWTPPNLPVDAVSALFMRLAIMNEYVLDAGTESGTDWTVLFPTKRFYVGGVTPQPPFTSTFGSLGACEPVRLEFWDREEDAPEGDIDFSPSTPIPGPELCWENNVINFVTSVNPLGRVNVLDSPFSLVLDVSPFEHGWARMSFIGNQAAGLPHQLVNANSGNVYNGLPVLGFQVQTFFNGDVGGLLSNYGGLFDHRASRLISGGTAGP